MKICTRCKENKQLNEFSKESKGKNGLKSKCKKCDSVKKQEYYNKNKEKIKGDVHNYRKENVEKIAIGQKKYYNDNICNFKNKHRYYRKTHAEEIKRGKRIWASSNLDKRAASHAKRRTTKLNATPKWLTKEQLDKIETFYTKAKELEQQTNTKHHVDHIVPLQGETVSGLHVPWNMQVITAEENLSKGNKLLSDTIVEITQ